VWGLGEPDDGTSAAAPIAAGAIAALRTKYPFENQNINRTPGNLKNFLIAEARYASGGSGFSMAQGWGMLATGRFDQAGPTMA
jgi:hypothetical protein